MPQRRAAQEFLEGSWVGGRPTRPGADSAGGRPKGDGPGWPDAPRAGGVGWGTVGHPAPRAPVRLSVLPGGWPGPGPFIGEQGPVSVNGDDA